MNGNASNDRGISCPACGCQHFFVIYTRRAPGGKLIRRRECRHCGRRITTYEYVIGNVPAEGPCTSEIGRGVTCGRSPLRSPPRTLGSGVR
jgi:hypothetical protein